MEAVLDSNIKQITPTNGSPGFYGGYDSKYYPSPSAGTNYPTSAANIGWSTSTKDQFRDITKIGPGSVGPIKYYNKYSSVFNGDVSSYQEMDSGILMQDWHRWNVINNNYETGLVTYDELRLAYNVIVEQHKGRDWEV